MCPNKAALFAYLTWMGFSHGGQRSGGWEMGLMHSSPGIVYRAFSMQDARYVCDTASANMRRRRLVCTGERMGSARLKAAGNSRQAIADDEVDRQFDPIPLPA